MKGVKSAVVKYRAGSAVVEYNPAEVAPDAFASFLTKAGYESSVVKTTPPQNIKEPATAACPSGC